MSLTINSRATIVSLLAFPIVYIGLKVAHRNGLINLGFGTPVSGGHVAASIPRKYLIAGGILAVGITCIALAVQSVRGRIAARESRLEAQRQLESTPQYRMSKLIGYTPEQYAFSTESEIRESLKFLVNRLFVPDYVPQYEDFVPAEKQNSTVDATQYNEIITDILFHYVYGRAIPFQAIFHPDYFSITAAEATPTLGQDSQSSIVQAGRDFVLQGEYVGLIRTIIEGAYRGADSGLPETTWFSVEFKIRIDGAERVTEVSSPVVERR